MPAKPQRGTVVRAFRNPAGDHACAVELVGGKVIRVDTLTRLEPGSEVEATFDFDRRTWSLKLARAVA